MNRKLGSLVILFGVGVLLGFLVAGCKRAPVQSEKKGDAKDDAKTNPFTLAYESFRFPENASGTDDVARFRDGLQVLGNSVSDLGAKIRLDAEDRKFLKDKAHLSDAELAEVDSTSFRQADAHYLDECFLLQDVARSIEIPGAGPVEQAHYQFRWVMRNVLLHEQGDDWVPPAYTLRRGYGGPLERALVFLALLRQFRAESPTEARLEGCLIVVPDHETRQILVGVYEPKTTNLRLFDPRLGLPVMSKDAKRIATLREALDDLELLAPSGITPAQVKKLEVRLVCPLFALAPRMKVVQDGLVEYPVTLHLNATALAEQIGKASPLPVTVWNSTGDPKKLANSPTRCLWRFLSREEGGGDAQMRALEYSRARLPMDSVVVNFGLLRVDPSQMPTTAWITLLKLSGDLLNKYDLQPREMRLRGLRDPMLRRQNRIEQFVKMDLTFTAGEIPDWLDRVRTVYAAVDTEDPKTRTKAQHDLRALWGEDLFLGRLIDADREDETDRGNKVQVLDKKGVLSKILAVGTRDYLKFEIARSQATANHEAAQRTQASLDAAASPGAAAKKRAAEDWDYARSAWSSFYLERISLQGKIDAARFQIQRIPSVPQNFDRLLSLLEGVHLDVQKYFNAKLRLTECKVHTDANGARDAIAYLESIKSEIEALERRGQLKGDLDDLTQATPPSDPAVRQRRQNRLDLLATDWSAQGNYYWMKQYIDRRVAALR